MYVKGGDRRASIGISEAINRVQMGLQVHGDKFTLTKIMVVTDGISADFEEDIFFNSVSRTVKPLGFSCHILLTGKS